MLGLWFAGKRSGNHTPGSSAIRHGDATCGSRRYSSIRSFSVRPTLIFIKLGYLLAVLGGIALVVLLALMQVSSAYISIPVGLALLLIPAYFHLKRNMIRYTLTDAKIEIDTGLIARTTRNIPLSKIQDVTVSASIPQRLMGFGDLIVDNASEMGGTTVLHNINKPRHYADLLLRELRRWH